MTLAINRPCAASIRLRLLASAAILGLGLTTPARADDVAALTSEQQASLARALSLWSAGLVGGDHGGKFQATPSGDHYLLEVPVGGLIGKAGASIEAGPLTASVRPLDDARWSFEDVKSPESIRLVPPAGTKGGPMTMTQKAADRSNHVVLDGTLATSSTFDSVASDVAVTAAATVDAKTFALTLHADNTNSHTVWQPAADGRVDAASTSTASGVSYEIAGDLAAKVSIKSLGSEGHMTGYAPGKLSDAVGIMLEMMATMPPPASKAVVKPIPTSAAAAKPVPATPAAHPTPEQRQAMHRLLDGLRDLYVSSDQSLTAEGVNVTAQGRQVSFDKLAESQGWSAPDGKAEFKMRLALDGIDSPQIPPGPMRDYVPRHVVFAPHVSGIPMDDLFAMANKAIDSDDPKQHNFTADGMALLAHGPVTVGIDELAFDVDKSSLTATGAMTISSPEDVAGSADIKLAGFDALLKRVGSDPMLKQTVPVLIFLKGIGQQDGDVVTWKVVYANQKVTVNGTDMSQLIPHGGAK